MKTADMAAYFAKKIAKPVQVDKFWDDDHFFYAVETTGADDEAMHVLVTTKYKMRPATR